MAQDRDAMNRIILIQHCQSEHHVNDLTGGWTDTPLTHLGRQQAAAIAVRLRRDLVDTPCRLYASDLKRAAQTAEIVGEELGLAVQSVPELREFNGGAATGKTRQWARENISREWSSSLFDAQPWDGAETWREFHARTSACLENLSGTHPSDSLPIVVTHGGALSTIVVWWLRLPVDALRERAPFSASPGSISVLARNPYDDPVIERLNDKSHLYQANLAEGKDLRC